MAQLLQMLPHLAYMVVLQNPEKATLELDKDIRRTLRAILRTVESPPPPAFLTSTVSILAGWDDVAVIPPIPFFTEGEENYWVEQYGIQGFQNSKSLFKVHY